MLESIIFHFVFVLFVIWAFVWWLITRKRLELLRYALLPAVLLKEIEFPRDRSLIVRSLRCLEDELEKIFDCPIVIQFKYSQFVQRKNFLTSLCYIVLKNDNEEDKYFLLDEKLYSAPELIKYFTNKIKIKRILFHYDYEKYIWKVCPVYHAISRDHDFSKSGYPCK